MTRSTLRELSAWLGGAMEPGELARFEEKLAANPDLARTAAALREPRPARPAWFLPGPGRVIGPSPFGARLEQALSMGPEQTEVPLTRVRFQAPDAEPRAVVVLLRAETGWRVLTPEPGEDPVFVAELPLLETGERELVLAALPADLRALALALPPAELLRRRPPADPWAALREAIADELVPVRTLSLAGPGFLSG